MARILSDPGRSSAAATPAQTLAALTAAFLLAGPALAAKSAPSDGQRLFSRKCAICHAEGGTGAIMLGLRLGKDRALLADRSDLQAPYITAVVRSGLRSMPPLTRVEVTDAQLAQIVTYLVRDQRPAARGAAP